MGVIAEQKHRGIVMERPGGMPDQVLAQRLQGAIRIRFLQQGRPVAGMKDACRALPATGVGVPEGSG